MEVQCGHHRSTPPPSASRSGCPGGPHCHGHGDMMEISQWSSWVDREMQPYESKHHFGPAQIFKKYPDIAFHESEWFNHGVCGPPTKSSLSLCSSSRDIFLVPLSFLTSPHWLVQHLRTKLIISFWILSLDSLDWFKQIHMKPLHLMGKTMVSCGFSLFSKVIPYQIGPAWPSAIAQAFGMAMATPWIVGRYAISMCPYLGSRP